MHIRLALTCPHIYTQDRQGRIDPGEGGRPGVRAVVSCHQEGREHGQPVGAAGPGFRGCRGRRFRLPHGRLIAVFGTLRVPLCAPIVSGHQQWLVLVNLLPVLPAHQIYLCPFGFVCVCARNTQKQSSSFSRSLFLFSLSLNPNPTPSPHYAVTGGCFRCDGHGDPGGRLLAFPTRSRIVDSSWLHSARPGSAGWQRPAGTSA